MNDTRRNGSVALVLGFLAAALLSQGADAQGVDSANYMVPGCQKFLGRSTDEIYAQGRCVGVVDALAFVSGDLPSNLRFCFPQEVTTGQSIRVAVPYIERHPQRRHEDFRLIALEAFHEAWPCN